MLQEEAAVLGKGLKEWDGQECQPWCLLNRDNALFNGIFHHIGGGFEA
jgi:hypothetical protein